MKNCLLCNNMCYIKNGDMFKCKLCDVISYISDDYIEDNAIYFDFEITDGLIKISANAEADMYLTYYHFDNSAIIIYNDLSFTFNDVEIASKKDAENLIRRALNLKLFY